MDVWDREEHEYETQRGIHPRPKRQAPAMSPQEVHSLYLRLNAHDVAEPISPRLTELLDALRWVKFGTPRHAEILSDLEDERARLKAWKESRAIEASMAAHPAGGSK